MREIGEHNAVLADQPYELAQLLMRPLEELVQQVKLGHDLEGGGMDGCRPGRSRRKSTCFSSTMTSMPARCEQIAEHHAGGSASGHTAAQW
jgi:hypothetical protein